MPEKSGHQTKRTKKWRPNVRPTKVGNPDEKNLASASDLANLITHLPETPSRSLETSVFADRNQDGVVDSANAELLADAILSKEPLAELPLA